MTKTANPRKTKTRSKVPIPIPDEREGKPSASSMDRDMRCTGSRALIAQLIADGAIPRPRETKYTLAGNKVHKALQTGDASDLCESQKVSVDIISSKEAQLIDDYNIDVDFVWRELREWSFDIAGNKIYSAKPDVVFYSKHNRTLMSINYKSGRVEVAPMDENYQVAAECLVYVNKAQNMGLLVEKAVGCIIQPLVKPIIKTREYTLAELYQLEPMFEEQCEKIEKNNVSFTAGQIQCEYCPARSHCPALAPVRKEFIGIESFDLKNMTPDHRRMFHDRLKLAGKLVDDLKERVKEYIRLGEVKGLYLIKDSSARIDGDYNAVVQELKKLGYLDTQINNASSITLGDLTSDKSKKELIIEALNKVGCIKYVNKENTKNGIPT